MYNLDGQVAIITGAASGIGRAIALRLSKEGAAVVAADLNEEAVEGLIQEIVGRGGQGLPLPLDVSEEKDVERMVRETLNKFDIRHQISGRSPNPAWSHLPTLQKNQQILDKREKFLYK